MSDGQIQIVNRSEVVRFQIASGNPLYPSLIRTRSPRTLIGVHACPIQGKLMLPRNT